MTAQERAARAWELKRHLQQVEDLHRAAVERQAAAHAEVVRKVTEELARLEASLVQEFVETSSVDEKTRRIPGTHVTVRARMTPPKWVYDEEAAIAWAAANDPSLIREKLELRKDVLKKWAAVEDGQVLDPNTGEQIPGVEVLPGEERLEVTYSAVTE